MTLDGVRQPGIFEPATGSVADYEYFLNCEGDTNASFRILASGLSGNYTYSYTTANGALPLTLNNGLITGASAGRYIFTVQDNDPTPPAIPAALGGGFYASCEKTITVDVISPLPLDLVEVNRVQPVCDADLPVGGSIEFEIINYDASRAPYTIRINSGALTAISAVQNVLFTGIDVNDPRQQEFTSIEIFDVFGCTTVINTLPQDFDRVNEYTVSFTTNDIACNDPNSGVVEFIISGTNEALLDLADKTVELTVRGSTSAYNEIIGFSDPTNTVLQIPVIEQADTYTYEFKMSGGDFTDCIFETGTFVINEVGGDTQIRVDIATDLDSFVGCNQTEITLTTSNTVGFRTVTWQEYDAAAQVWNDRTDLANQLTVVVFGGTYKAFVRDSRLASSTCSTNTFETRDIIIPEKVDPTLTEVARIEPGCPGTVADGAIQFRIENYNPLNAPYTVSLNNGLLSGTTTSNLVSITGIDVQLYPSITSAQIEDVNFCTSSVTLNINFPAISDTPSVTVTTNDISCSDPDSGVIEFEVTFSGATPLYTFIVQNDPANPNLFAVVTNTTASNFDVALSAPGDYIYSLSTTGSVTCINVVTGTFSINSVTTSNTIRTGTLTRTLAGCGNENSTLSLGGLFNVVPPFTITWETLVPTPTAQGEFFNVWTSYDNGSQDNNIILNNVGPGRYRAIIVDGRDPALNSSSCSTNTLIAYNPLVFNIPEVPELSVLEVPNSRITPICPPDLDVATPTLLSYEVLNAVAGKTYEVSILNGLYVETVTASDPIAVFSQIDVTDPTQRSINQVLVTDAADGCSATVTVSVEFPPVYEYTVGVTTSDIDCGSGTSGQVIFDIITQNTSATFGPDDSPKGFLEIRGGDIQNPFVYFQAIAIPGTVTPVTLTTSGTYNYTLFSNVNGIVCEAATGTFDIAQLSPSQITVSHAVASSTCNDESVIELTIEGAVAPYTIQWQSRTVTYTASAGNNLPGLVLEQFVWSDVANSNGLSQGSIRVPEGTYRAIIVDSRQATNLLSGCSTNTFVTQPITVEQTNPLGLTEVRNLRITPECPNDLAAGGRLVFEIDGFNQNDAPYRVVLNDGQLLTADTGPTNTNREVSFTIDVTDLDQREITQATIYSFNGCSETVSLSISFPEVQEYDVQVTTTDIDCSVQDSGQINFTILARNISGLFDVDNPAQVNVRGQSIPFEVFRELANGESEVEIPVDVAGTYEYSITIGGTNTCIIQSGQVRVEDTNNAQLIVDVDITQPGCGVDFGTITLDIPSYVAPLEVEWFEYINVVSGPATNTTSSAQWVPRTGPQYDDRTILTNLEPGIYRARVTDGRVASCGNGEFITRDLRITQGSLRIENLGVIENLPQVSSDDCINYPTPFEDQINWSDTSSTYSGDFLFSFDSNIRRNNYNNSVGFNFRLTGPDGSEVDLENHIRGFSNLQLASIPNINYPGTYRIRNLPQGVYVLAITENGTPTAEFTPCSEIMVFDIPVKEPIEVQLLTSRPLEVDPCLGTLENGLRVVASGGVPFPNGEYQYEWTFTPNDPSEPSQLFYGSSIDPAYPGNYCLRVIDNNGYAYCSCDEDSNEFTYEVIDRIPPIEVTGAIPDPDEVGVLTKSLSPDCSSGGINGKIAVNINGGQLPYNIYWYAEDPRYLNADSSIGYRPLDGTNGNPDFTNRTSIDGLLPGNYKIVIESVSSRCNQQNQYNYYEEIIQVAPNRELYIIDGPYVDEDLCRGQQGRLIVDIFDNNEGNLSFYYNDILIPNSDVVRLSDRSWSVAIVNAIDSANFRIVNEEGCWITTEINRGIGEPNFRYSSPNFNSSSVILAREEVTFENTSTDPYVTSEWIFGDNTPPEIVPTLIDSIIPVRHAYGVSGTYFATLRIYNDIGCSEEITYPVSVGKGYNLMVPNVFTPNNDLVNDTFKPLFSGFLNMTFTVYDYRGNVVYNEYAEESDPNNIQGINITGWNGENAPYSPYYIYTAYGVLLDGETEIEKSGTFIIIN